jgi:sialidase-1
MTREFQEIHVVHKPRSLYWRTMPGNILPLKDGRLMLCYTDMDPASLRTRDIMGMFSADGGPTWGQPFVLVPKPPDTAAKHRFCAHPTLLRTPGGNLLLSYISAAIPNKPDQPYYGQNYCRRSSDEGATWSDQFCMTPAAGYILCHNDKVKVLSTGRIVAMVERRKVTGKNDHAGYVASAFTSDDDGISWWMSRNEVDTLPVEAQEPDVVELRDGRLMMVYRTYSGHPGRAYSTDLGETWSKGEMMQEIPMSPYASAITVGRIPSTGDLLMVLCTGGVEGRRTPLTTYLSKDDGQTWTNPRAIASDPGDDHGYQSLLFLGDVAILSYHKMGGLYIARIGVDWLYEA